MSTTDESRLQDLGLLFLRLSGALFLLWVHGLPKLLNYSAELTRIEDPFHLGAAPTLILAGVLVRLACLPILFLLAVALLVVHPQWSLEEGQFGWLLLIVFTSVFIAGPGRLAMNARFAGVLRHA
jgi:putative oxidoreductase